MSEDPPTVEIAGLSFEARGSGDVLTGVVGPAPQKNSPGPTMPLEGMTRAHLPFDRWSRPAETDEGPLFILDEPVIYVGTTALGLHSALIGVKETTAGPPGLGLMTWTDEGNGVGLRYHWPRRADRPSFGWSFEDGNPVECVIQWFPLPAETAHIDCTFDGKTIAATVRPVSRVAVVQLPPATEIRLVDALAYDAGGKLLLRGRP